MAPSRRPVLLTAALAVLGAVVVTPRASSAADDACAVLDTEYDVIANIFIRDTPFGAANGAYALGSGRMTLRMEQHDGRKLARLMAYELSNHLTVQAKVAMVSTKVVTISQTTALRDACDGSALGTLGGNVWKLWSATERDEPVSRHTFRTEVRAIHIQCRRIDIYDAIHVRQQVRIPAANDVLGAFGAPSEGSLCAATRCVFGPARHDRVMPAR
jgi:hypothetical protein